ncbi:succinate dehydrogenase, cytochrome b556 subunit [Uliginosibacterium aquaticum]|uniref:Succinate dehydrogenase cytochrome b556 subunit n=1 Tax=Uliginosibacterium aquaticum TaxID=2731212 RepID=A0ABX2IKA2_9RHOO|nr:succinate dehydrogenase, cytochrome b556 subunit [Uliginosibacterium aquaticum]NSL54475.1 succinate dehydrogenase, cytochrome b556 subunit [Uliginosibacterium aquaticum]
MAEATVRKARPKHLNLMQIRLPLPGFVSILHRISGIGLFLCLPVLIALFGASLGTPEQLECYRQAMAFTLLGLPVVKLLLLGLLWAYLHHFCAGIRFLLLDMHIGIELAPARASAMAVLVISLSLTAFLGVLTW